MIGVSSLATAPIGVALIPSKGPLGITKADIDAIVDALMVRLLTTTLRANVVQYEGATPLPLVAPTPQEILSTFKADVIPVDVRRVRGQIVGGSGSEEDPWGPV